ncbi:MAG: hypothetical protein NTV34_12565, partial [Proteobacteria bacterium]|nr:hypothetical protein [Pseudomonadota bacterium]
QIAPGLVSEAIGQLTSWKVMTDSNFTSRPVFLFSERLEVLGEVFPGEKVSIKSTIHKMGADTVTFSGSAWVGNRIVQRLTDCTNFLIPISELEDEQEVRSRFQDILRLNGSAIDDDSDAVDLSACILEVEDTLDESFRVVCQVPETMGFYRDHFSKRPITPIVILNEIISIAVQKTLGASERLSIKEVGKIKMKSFIGPNEKFSIQIKKIDRSDPELITEISIHKSDKVLLRGRYSFAINI